MNKEDFNKIWKDTSREGILNQFYYEHYELIKYQEVIDKAKDKLYCWGEVLDTDFQKQMLDILKEVE